MKSLIGDELLFIMANIAKASPSGCFVEVGVYQGGSAKVLYDIAKEQGRDIFLYDTFDGMPFCDEIDSHHEGMFADCHIEKIKEEMPDAILVKGIFPESLVEMPKIAFVHADADQYQSTKNISRFLGPQMVSNGAILFDDYRGVSGCIKAVDEDFPDREVLPDGRALVRFRQ